MKNLTIAQKLLLCISLSMLLIVGGATVVQYRLFSGLVTERVTAEELPATLESIRNDIDATLTGPITTAQSLAHNPYLHSWLSEGEVEEGTSRAVSYLQTIQNHTGASSVFYISAQSGNYYTVNGIARAISREKDQWFYDLVDAPDGDAYRLVINSEGGHVQVFINHVVEIDGQRLGVAGVGYSLDAMTEMIRNYQLGKSGSVFLASLDGTIRVHPEGAALVGEPISALPGWESITNELLGAEGYRYATARDAQGAEQLVAAIEVPGTDWAVFAQIPHAELFADLNRAVLLVVLIVALMLVASLSVIALLLKALFRPIRRTAHAMREIAEGDGDLTLRLPIDSRDEIGELSTQFNAFVARMQETLREVRTSTTSVYRAAGDIAQGSEELASRTDQAAANLQETSASMEEITSTVNQSADSAQQANQLVQSTAKVAQDGEASMVQVERTMDDISQSAVKISDIISMIDSIAFQTNILALNASVEAARAGEHGRGFAVVAQEVRILASRSSDASSEIRRLIDTSAAHTHAGADLVRNTGETMREIVASVSRVTDVIGEISAAAKEQSSGIGQVNTAVSEMDTMTQQNAMMVQQTSCAAGDMRNHAERLNELISSFVLGGETTQGQSSFSPRSSATPAMVPQRLSDRTEARRRNQPEGEAWESF